MKIGFCPQNFKNYKKAPKNISLGNVLQTADKIKYSNLGLSQLANINLAKINFTGVQKIEDTYPKHTLDNYSGCLIGGAIGDALGAPVEFMTLDAIKKEYGDDGIRDFELNELGEAEFTDDTQMTIFTADGLLKDVSKNFNPNKVPNMNTIFESYNLWLNTQQYNPVLPDGKSGWISEMPGLYKRKSPGNTCISSIKSGKIGTIDKPINFSKGCGGVMRVAPVGLLYCENPKTAFSAGASIAAITHGHPSGYLSAGALSSLIAYIIQGEDLNSAIDKTISILKTYKNHEETLNAILKATTLAQSNTDEQTAIKEIGGGWTGEQALAIAIYSSLKHADDFDCAVETAVNHSGDSDSTGAITGNIMGAYCGIKNMNAKRVLKIQDCAALKKISEDILNFKDCQKQIAKDYPYKMGHIPHWYNSKSAYNKPCKLKYVVFSKEDMETMNKMTVDEKLEFRKKLIQEGKYSNPN